GRRNLRVVLVTATADVVGQKNNGLGEAWEAELHPRRNAADKSQPTGTLARRYVVVQAFQPARSIHCCGAGVRACTFISLQRRTSSLVRHISWCRLESPHHSHSCRLESLHH